MDLRRRILLAFLALGCFIGGTFVVEQLALPLITPDQQVPESGILLDTIFTKADFRYGPQTWRPYYDPLAIDPSRNMSATDMWYMMYIDLNGTPVSGNPDVRRLGAMNVTYRFSALAGKAVFHVYAPQEVAGPTRTNRQDGYNRCGYVVSGSHAPGQSMPATTVLPYSVTHDYAITLSNVHENGDDFRAATRRLWFERPGSGLDALHITRDLAVPKGEVTETTEQEGTFFVTATGARPGDDLILLVAVNRMQPEDFSLTVRSEFVGVS
jgi:hypothetical protein